MPICVDCGTEVIDMGYEEEVVRCYDCLYQNNFIKATHKTMKYCLIVIGGIMVFTILFELVLGFLFHYIF